MIMVDARKNRPTNTANDIVIEMYSTRLLMPINIVHILHPSPTQSWVA